MEVLAFIIFLIIFLPIVLIIFALQNREEGTLEERERDPNLNCNDWDFHWPFQKIIHLEISGFFR